MSNAESVRLQQEAQTRHQLQMAAPGCWRELCGKLNAANTYQTVTLKAPRCDLEVTLSQEHPHITYAMKNTSTGVDPLYGTLSFVMIDRVVFLQLERGPGIRPFDRTGVPMTIDEAAKFLLGKLT